MSISFHSILELNNRKPVLNSLIKFFRHEDKNYAYLNRLPGPISFMELSNDMIEIIKQFDGTKTVNEIVISNPLDTDFFEFIGMLYKNSVIGETHNQKAYPAVDTASILFFPTTACNLRCVYCYASAGDNPPMMIDLKKADAWINYIFSHLDGNIKNVRLLFHGGGEPTSAFSLMKIIWEKVKSKSKEANLKASIHSITNGNFNEDILKWFIQEKAVLTFSIDGTKDGHDLLRPRADGKGSFEPAIKNLKKLGEAGIRIGIRCTVTNSNINHLKELIDIGKECGIKAINFEPFSSFGRAKNSNNINISFNDFVDKFSEVWQYAFDNGILVTGYSAISIRPGRNYFCNTYQPSSFALTSEGFLSPCPEVSLQSDPVSDVFFTGKINDDCSIEFYEDRIEKLKDRTTDTVPVCKECFLEHVCNCGCSVKSFRKYNDLLKVDSEKCELIKALSPIILKTLLYESEKFSEIYKIDHLNYSNKKGNVFSEYIAFNSFNF